jgi:hypothetical protein
MDRMNILDPALTVVENGGRPGDSDGPRPLHCGGPLKACNQLKIMVSDERFQEKPNENNP